jgi:hypothetical protein
MIVKKPWPYQFKMQKIIIRSVAESFFLDPPFEKKKKSSTQWSRGVILFGVQCSGGGHF